MVLLRYLLYIVAVTMSYSCLLLAVLSNVHLSCRLSKTGPARGLPAAFHTLFDLVEDSFKAVSSSFHQNLKKFLRHYYSNLVSSYSDNPQHLWLTQQTKYQIITSKAVQYRQDVCSWTLLLLKLYNFSPCQSSILSVHGGETIAPKPSKFGILPIN